MTEFLQTLVLGLLLGGVYALVASGLTLIFGVMRVINIAHGAFLILAAFITYSLWTRAGLDPLLAIVITTPVDVRVRLADLHADGPADPDRADGLVGAADLRAGAGARGRDGRDLGQQLHSVRPAYVNESFTIGGIFLPKAQVYGGLAGVVVLAVALG